MTSLFETIYRSGLVDEPLLSTRPAARLADVAAQVPEALVGDVSAMVAVAETSFLPGLRLPPSFQLARNRLNPGAELERPQQLALQRVRVVTGPLFTLSKALGGADGDLIVDETLVELKTTARPMLTRQIVWQLTAYLLADTEDVYEMRRVALYFARHGCLWSFPAHEWLSKLAGSSVELAACRRVFAEVARANR